MVFNINNLRCRYHNGPIVLEVPSLQLNRGELVFIIGASGIGKSTFLEALGLMNQTISSLDVMDSSVDFFTSKGAVVPLTTAWELPNRQLSEIRRTYFSFIFQQTNLFPHFTVGENMMMADLLAGTALQEAEAKARDFMDELDLEQSLFSKSVMEVSGGQRQRLAFVRAFASPFEVLFADEPTGNLDPVTSRKLMHILKDHLRDIDFPKTGILVSHDIRLALEFADKIIPISPFRAPGRFYGVVDASNILIKSGSEWRFEAGKELVEDPHAFLWNQLSKQA
jgi:ABC-type lipoprotein export system ATPase subunit